MKKLLFILFFIPLMGFGQPEKYLPNDGKQKMGNSLICEYDSPKSSVFYYWNQYLSDCNELIPDTIKQDGVVNVKYRPVIVNGDISHYLLTPVDTVWTECKCREYKMDDNKDLVVRGFADKWRSDNVTLTGSLYVGRSITYSEPEQINNKINITRNKICHIKKRKANWEDFWNRWLVEQKVIEIN